MKTCIQTFAGSLAIMLLVRLVPAWALGTMPPSSPPTPPPERNVQGMWWASPAGSEPGWGLNISHQGSTLFATWFTYDTDGTAVWYVISDAKYGYFNDVTGVYSGRMHRAKGPVFSETPWTSAEVQLTDVGSVDILFTDVDHGYFQYQFDANNVWDSKAITRYDFASPLPHCTWSTVPAATTNYTDMWWRSPPGSEAGWGVNIVQQGDVLFAMWFTFRADGSADWIMMSNGTRAGDATWTGTLYRARGPPPSWADRRPWDATQVVIAPVGTGTFTFASGDSGTFGYTLDGVTQSKTITRYLFSTPPTLCS